MRKKRVSQKRVEKPTPRESLELDLPTTPYVPKAPFP